MKITEYVLKSRNSDEMLKPQMGQSTNGHHHYLIKARSFETGGVGRVLYRTEPLPFHAVSNICSPKLNILMVASLTAATVSATSDTMSGVWRFGMRTYCRGNVGCRELMWGYEYTHFFYKQPVYKQPVLRPLKNAATFKAQKSPVA